MTTGSPEFMERMAVLFGSMMQQQVIQNGIVKANCQGCSRCDKCGEYACRHTLLYKQSMPSGVLDAVLLCVDTADAPRAAAAYTNMYSLMEEWEGMFESQRPHEGRLPE